MKKSVSQLAVHFGLWLVIIFLLLPVGSYFSNNIDIGNINSIYLKAILLTSRLIIPSIIFFYIMFFFTKIIIRKKWTLVFPISLYLLTCSFLIFPFRNGVELENLFIIRFHIFLAFVFGLLGSMFRIQIEWFKNKQEKYELEKQNNESTMALLKNQINPHFLFNTLHNIDTLIHDNQDKASKSLVKLSDIMRYMLKETKTDFVELKNEIAYLENYFSLEGLRIKNEKFFNYSISGSYNRLKIAPMILIPFVENAFKHAVDSGIENGIVVKISIKNNKLIFNCENQYDKSESDKDKTHGIGLETVQKRLDLIYKNKHKLIINSENSVFTINLELELDEN